MNNLLSSIRIPIFVMTQGDHLVHAVAAGCLILALGLTTGSASSGNNLNQAHTQSRSYFDEISRVGKLAQQKQFFESNSIQVELDEISEKLFSFSRTLSQPLQNERPTNFMENNNEGTDLIDFQKVLAVLDTLAANNASSSTCINDTTLFLISIFKKQPWAVQFLDSFGKPGPGLTLARFNFVGNYAQCRAASALSADGSRRFRGNYCTLNVAFGPPSTLGLLNFHLGACMPDTCSISDNTLFVSEVIQLLGLNGTLHADAAECHTEERHITAATVAAITILIIIAVLMLIGTSFDIIFVQWPKWKASSNEEEDLRVNGLITQVPSYSAIGADSTDPNNELTPLLGKVTPVQHGVCTKVLLAFSVYTNGSKVLNTRQPPGSLSSIHGIRFLSMSWVILGHLFIFGLGQVGNIASVILILFKRWTFNAIGNAFVSVDTFFTLSGLLTAYLTLAEIKKRGWKINWGLFYFHRFWRLTPPYMLTIVIILGLQQYFGSGPLWPSVQPLDKSNCENYWWANLLYINNLVDSDKMCFGHSWYLANDMQFFLLSPLMIVPFYFNFKMGLAVCGCFLLISWTTIGVISTQNEWPPTLVSNGHGAGGMNANLWFKDYYIKPWCRIGAYVVGAMAGSYLAIHNGRIKMRWYVVLIGWIVAITTGLAVVYGLYGDISGDNPSSVGMAALYNAVARSAWGACVCWVIIACASGYGGFVNSILSWSPFVVLGRLTYLSYLIHPCLLYVYFQNQDELYYINDTGVVVTFVGIVVLTNMFAFVLMLAIESPWISLEGVFLRNKKKH